jgi:hypothetical protein
VAYGTYFMALPDGCVKFACLIDSLAPVTVEVPSAGLR